MPKTIHTFLAALIIFASLSSYAETPQKFKDDATLSQWTMNYYKKPEPHLVLEAIQEYSAQGLLKDPKKYPPIVGFIVGANEKNPEIITELSNNIKSFQWEDQKTIIYTIWLSGNKNTKNILRSLVQSGIDQEGFIQSFLNRKQRNLFDRPSISSASILDMYWGYFFATGDEYPVIQIIGTLKWLDKPENITKNDLARLLVAGAAQWSLQSLCMQDDRVFHICRQQLSVQPKEIKGFLEEIVTNVEKKRAENFSSAHQ